MAVTVREIGQSLMDSFQLKLIAGAQGVDHVVTWVHLMEDTSVLDFFWGNEMVVTSCYTLHNLEDLMRTLEILDVKRSAGMVINIGHYIETVPQEVMDYCERMSFPLYTMPWQMSMTEFVRASCTMITQSMQTEESVAKAVLAAVNSPQNPGGYHETLSSYFNEELGFRMLAINYKHVASSKSEGLIVDQRTKLRFHTALHSLKANYLIFRDISRTFILINDPDRDLAYNSARSILNRIHDRMPNVPVQIGIGNSCSNFAGLSDAYHSALSAQRSGRVTGNELVEFSQMGFYRLLYSVPDDALLESYYYETMNPLLEYDQAHNTNLAETLFRYLLSDGSLNEVASQMFTHRNTVNYRMGKIRELLGCSLSTASEKLPYLIAYHTGVILKLIKRNLD